MRRASAAMLAALLVIALLMSAVACWLRVRDAVAGLPREATGDLPCIRQLVGRQQGRRFTHITLEGTAVGRIRFVVSLPDPMPQERIPLVVVVAGQRTAAEMLSVLGDLGPNAIVWFSGPFRRAWGWIESWLAASRRSTERRSRCQVSWTRCSAGLPGSAGRSATV